MYACEVAGYHGRRIRRVDLAEWVRLCGLVEAPEAGQLKGAEVNGVSVCLANVDGELSAVGNWCPHRGAPLAEGWLEGRSVVCPWHSWTFCMKTGEAEYPVHERVTVFRLKTEGEDVLVALEPESVAGAVEEIQAGI
jgi:nitrite reductase (NADH) small subunit